MSGFAARKAEVSARFSQAAAHYAQHAALQAQIADALLSLMQPAGVVLDVGCGRGREAHLLANVAGVEKVIAVDAAAAMLQEIPAHPRVQTCLADMEALPLANECAQQIFSNFALQWCAQPSAVCAEMARVLTPGGELFFSVPGPASLSALRATQLMRVNQFASAQDWVVALMQAGFSDCDIVQKDFTAHFQTPRELLLALKGIGANTSDTPRDNFLHGRAWWQQVQHALEAARQPQGLPLQYEVIFIRATRDE